MLVVESVIPLRNETMFGKLMDLIMLVVHGGMERTEPVSARWRYSTKANPRTTLKAVGKLALAALFILGGIGHFVATDVYLRIMPPYLPYHRALMLLSGVFEVVLGLLLLVPATSRLAAWGLVVLLVDWPSESYPNRIQGNGVERIRNWAYVHE